MSQFRRSKGTEKTIPIFKLSAQMVDLSLQHNQRDSLLSDIPARLAVKCECLPPEPKIDLASATQGEEKNTAQLACKTEADIELVRVSRELLRISISWIREQRVRIHDSRLRTSIR